MKTGEAVLIAAVVVGMAAGQIFFKLAALAMARGEGGNSFILWRFVNPVFSDGPGHLHGNYFPLGLGAAHGAPESRLSVYGLGFFSGTSSEQPFSRGSIRDTSSFGQSFNHFGDFSHRPVA